MTIIILFTLTRVIMWRVCEFRYSIVLVILGSAIIQAASPMKYRDDYVYNARSNAFYKLHIEQVSYERAKAVCGVEGATLMVASSIYDTSQVHGMMKSFPDLGNFVWIGDDGEEGHELAEDLVIVGDHDYDTQTFQSTGKCTVLTRGGKIEDRWCGSSWLPFVCKVAAKDAFYDSKCQVYSKDFNYIESVGSCYKIPRIVYTWNQALGECRAEGAHLVVVNSDAESQELQTLMTRTQYLEDSYSKYYYNAGIRAEREKEGEPRVFRTIFNETLEEAGFAKWADTEPNNLNHNEYCGSLYESDGRYNDHNCKQVYGFICEKEIHLRSIIV